MSLGGKESRPLKLRVLEVGTGAGERSLALARALPPGGSLISMEPDPAAAAVARKRFADAGCGDRINVIVGDPARFLHKLRGPFELIVAGDASLRDRLRPLLAPGGLLLVEDDKKYSDQDMTMAEWLAHAKADAEKRGLPELIPMLEGLAQSTERLRAADWNDTPDKGSPFDCAQDKPRDHHQ